jgi:hypothetical protein
MGVLSRPSVLPSLPSALATNFQVELKLIGQMSFPRSTSDGSKACLGPEGAERFVLSARRNCARKKRITCASTIWTPKPFIWNESTTFPNQSAAFDTILQEEHLPHK